MTTDCMVIKIMQLTGNVVLRAIYTLPFFPRRALLARLHVLHSRVEHAEEHYAFVDGDPQAAKLERERVALGSGNDRHCTATVWQTLVLQFLTVDRDQGVANWKKKFQHILLYTEFTGNETT